VALRRPRSCTAGTIVANSVTTAVAVPLIFLLPRLIVGRRDAEPIDEGSIARTAME
jgi:hypothetical protein